MQLKFKGGPGSGFHGHKGRPGQVGGSSNSSIKFSVEDDPEYYKGLILDLRNREQQLKSQGFRILNRPSDDAMYHLGYRTPNNDGDRFFLDAALAKYVEEATGDREIMLEVMGSQSVWNSSPARATNEHLAAMELGGSGIVSESTSEYLNIAEPLSDAHIRGYEAKLEFTRAYFRHLYGDEVEVYRGVYDTQAYNIRNSGADIGDSLPLDSYQLSSYTTSKWAAQTFGRTVLKRTISYKDVWMFDKLGVRDWLKFAEDADEIVTLNDKSYVDVVLEDL